MPTYYRALVNEVANSNWIGRNFISYHNYPSQDWVNIWRNNHSCNADDYPLHCTNGIFTESARSKFIELYPYTENRVLTDDELRQLSQLNGVFAFDNPQSALEYAETSKLFLGFVEFCGEYITNASEGNGVIASVVTIDENIYTREEFIERHNLNTQIK